MTAANVESPGCGAVAVECPSCGAIVNWSCHDEHHGGSATDCHPERAVLAALAEACDLADEANGDPSSCSHSVPIGERVAELRRLCSRKTDG